MIQDVRCTKCKQAGAFDKLKYWNKEQSREETKRLCPSCYKKAKDLPVFFTERYLVRKL